MNYEQQLHCRCDRAVPDQARYPQHLQSSVSGCPCNIEERRPAFTNFEGTIAGRFGGWPLKGSFFDCSKPVVLDALQDTGFRALSLSNNHAFDLGPSGILSTLEEVEERGFLHAGIGRNRNEAAQPCLGQTGERKIAIVAMDAGPGPDFMYADDAGKDRPERPGINRLGTSQLIDVDNVTFDELRSVREKVGYTELALTNDSQPNDPYPVNEREEVCIGRAVFRRSDEFRRSVKIDEGDLNINLQAISDAAQDDRLVIAYLHHHHWATDWLQVPDWVRGVAKQCIDAGAAAFVSHGAPVLQGMEIYRKRPIFYSLGNFIFHVPSDEGTWRAPEVWESVMGACSFDDNNNLSEAVLHPLLSVVNRRWAERRSSSVWCLNWRESKTQIVFCINLRSGHPFWNRHRNFRRLWSCSPVTDPHFGTIMQTPREWKSHDMDISSELTERFFRYAAIASQSNAASTQLPSSPDRWNWRIYWPEN